MVVMAGVGVVLEVMVEAEEVWVDIAVMEVAGVVLEVMVEAEVVWVVMEEVGEVLVVEVAAHEGLRILPVLSKLLFLKQME